MPKRGGFAGLKVGLPEAGDALVYAGRIENANVEVERLTDPVAEVSVVGAVVVGQRMNERAEARRFDCCDHVIASGLEEVDLVLGKRMRTDAAVGQAADEQDLRIVGEVDAQAVGRGAFIG